MRTPTLSDKPIYSQNAFFNTPLAFGSEVFLNRRGSPVSVLVRAFYSSPIVALCLSLSCTLLQLCFVCVSTTQTPLHPHAHALRRASISIGARRCLRAFLAGSLSFITLLCYLLVSVSLSILLFLDSTRYLSHNPLHNLHSVVVSPLHGVWFFSFVASFIS